MAVPDGLASCPLCRSWVHTVSLRRVALWSVLVVDALLLVVFRIAR